MLNLELVKLPESIDHIERNAFEGSGLESINIPRDCTVGEDVFKNCVFLKEIQVVGIQSFIDSTSTRTLDWIEKNKIKNKGNGALNNMQNKKIFNTFLESIEEQEIKSYAQLIQLLSGTDLEDTELLLKELQNLTFIEDEEVLYNKLPMAVYYKQLPVVLNSDILVKVVIMQQADGLILVVPENIVETYQDLVEDAELISEKNNGISLYAEIYNFEMSDPKLQDLIKATYVASGNELKAFDLKDKLAKEQKR